VGSNNNTYTLYDESGRWVGDYVANGAPVQQAIWINNLPVGLRTGTTGSLTYIEPDHLGSPRVVIDPVANIAMWKWDLNGEAFGSTTPEQDPDGNGTSFVLDMRSPGQRYDSASGLNYNYFRDYEPGTGRYVQSDPIGLNGGLITYAYVAGNPVSTIDPLGLTQCDIDTALAAVRQTFPDLNLGAGAPVVDLPRPPAEATFYTAGEARLINQGSQMNIAGRDGLMHLNERYLEKLTEGGALSLLSTIIHEGLHFTRPFELQGQGTDFDHPYIREETKRRVELGKDSYLKARASCLCGGDK
jgi:RHS repeat-associated protein